MLVIVIGNVDYLSHKYIQNFGGKYLKKLIYYLIWMKFFISKNLSQIKMN